MVSVWRPLPSRGSRTPHLVRVGPSSARSPPPPGLAPCPPLREALGGFRTGGWGGVGGASTPRAGVSGSRLFRRRWAPLRGKRFGDTVRSRHWDAENGRRCRVLLLRRYCSRFTLFEIFCPISSVPATVGGTRDGDSLAGGDGARDVPSALAGRPVRTRGQVGVGSCFYSPSRPQFETVPKA